MKYKILIVEDEALLSLAYRLALQERDCIVTAITPSGEEAIEAAEHTHPDVVIVDIKLSGQMDGIETAKVIKLSLGIPCIFITGNTDEGTRQKAMEADPLNYIEKPLASERLFDIIDEAMH